MATLPWIGEDEGTGGRPIKIRPQKTKRKPKPAAATGPKTPPSEYDIAVQRAKAAENMKSALTQMDFPAGGEKGVAGPDAGLGFLMDPSQYPGGFTSPEFGGIATGGAAAAAGPIIAGQGIARLLSAKMVKDLPKGGALKGIGDIPKSLVAKIDARSRKLFGKDPKDLNKVEAQGLFTDVVDKKNYAPVRAVKTERAAVTQEAQSKTAAVKHSTGRKEEGAGITATIRRDAKAADAAGTPAIAVAQPAAKTGTTRTATGEGAPVKGARAELAGKETRETTESLKSQVSRQAEPRAAAPSMAGEKLTPAQVDAARQKAATTARKVETKAIKATTKASDAEAKSIGKTSDGIDGTGQFLDPSAATKQHQELQVRLDKVKDTASPEVLKTIQNKLTKLKNRLGNTAQQADASTKRAKLQQAAERKAASEAAEPANAAKALESFNAFLKLKPAEQKSIGKRASAMAKKPWEEMTGAERRRFVHAVWTTPQVGHLPRHATPQQRSVISQRRERVGSQRRQRAARETQAADVASQKEAATAKAAAKEAEAAKKVGPIEAVERGARQVVTAAPKALGAGAKKGKELAGKAWRGELSKKAPLGSAALAAGTGAAYLAKKHFVESEEEAMTEAAQKKLDAAGISVPKALGRKKIKDAKIKASRAHDKVGWYGDPVTKWPKNWLSLYRKMHEWGGPGWEARPEYLDYLQDLNKSPKQGRATAAKDFARMVQKLINRKVLQPDTLNTSYGDNDTAADFDLEALGSILNRKAAK